MFNEHLCRILYVPLMIETLLSQFLLIIVGITCVTTLKVKRQASSVANLKWKTR